MMQILGNKRPSCSTVKKCTNLQYRSFEIQKQPSMMSTPEIVDHGHSLIYEQLGMQKLLAKWV